MSEVERPLEWFVSYTDPDDPMLVWVALDETRLFRFVGNEVITHVTDIRFRKSISPVRDLTFDDILRYWKTDHQTVDAYIDTEMNYSSYQDTTLNKTNRGYLTHGEDDDEVQNLLLRIARVHVTGNLE